MRQLLDHGQEVLFVIGLRQDVVQRTANVDVSRDVVRVEEVALARLIEEATVVGEHELNDGVGGQVLEQAIDHQTVRVV